MRRPPDKEGQHALSEKDVESSNATLNTLFGGSRQKSWMTQGTSVRPTPRTSTTKSFGLPIASTQRSASTILPSPAPSDEPSPILLPSQINRAQNDNRRESRADEVHSPAPTFTPNQQVFSSEFESEPAQGARTFESSSRPNSSSSRAPDHLRRPSTNPVSPTDDTLAIMENPPLPNSIFLQSEEQDNRHVPRELYSPTDDATPLSETNIAQSHTLQSPRTSILSGLGITPRPALAQYQENNNPDGSQQVIQGPVERGQFVNSGQVKTSSAARVSDYPSPTSINMSSYPSPSIMGASNPNKRLRTQPPAMSSLRPRISLIEKHIQSVGGMMNLNTGLERPRFQLLKDACLNEDSFYVALHQVFCVWDFNRSEVTSIQGYPNSTVLQTAFNILGQLIRDNVQLAPNHKIWFANFPGPLTQLLQSSEPYRQTVMNVGAFLSQLAGDWDPLSSECSQRGYPPLVDELVNRWRLLSPTLQSIVFTAIRRNLGYRDQEVGTRMEELFQRDRQEHQALASRINTARPPTASDFRERKAALVNEYLTLHNRIAQRRSSTAFSGSPLVRGPAPPLASSVPYQQSSTVPVVHTAAWQGNMPSPNTGSWQQHGVPRASTNSPNLSLIAARPPSIGAHRGHSNAPSPTLLQGLSMHSPNQQSFDGSPTNGGINAHGQSNQNILQGHGGSTVSRPNIQYQPNVDPAAQQRNQIAIQHQQMLPQQHFQPQNPSQYQPHQNEPQYQAQQYQQHQPQHYQPTQVAWQQNSSQSAQQQAMLRQQQHQQQQMRIDQQLRAAQMIRNNSINDPHNAHIRTNSVNSAGSRTPGPSPRIGVLATGRPVSHEQVLNAYKATHLLNRSIIPPHGFVHQSFPALPDQVALHQAHLRSPRLVAADPPPRDIPTDSPSLKCYQSMRGFALQPTKISINSPLSKFEFTPPEADFSMIAQDNIVGKGQVSARQFRRGTLQYRLRCVQMKQGATKCLTADWVLQDTVWPEGASLAINKKPLELRRKNHHGKDLPLDITPLVRLVGLNVSCQIALSILKGRSRMKEHSYFIAVEVIEILEHDQIMSCVRKNRISASTTLDNIKRKIGGHADDDDDDIVMAVSDVSIDLADPFTARIYDTPVRGMNCLHRECFDLETFLITRTSKPKRPGQPCMIDVWKCPLCGKDARPYRLQIDDFLVSVRQTLEAQGNLDAKAIWISGDGTWRPKIEKRKAPPEHNDSDSDDDALGNSSMIQSGDMRSNRLVEVISLDD